MKIKEDVTRLAQEVGATNLRLPKVEIEKGSLQSISAFLKSNNYRKVVLVVDDNTNEVAGMQLTTYLTVANIKVKSVLLKPNNYGQVIADEKTIIQLLVETSDDIDGLLAVGTGTIHDIVRFVSYKMGIPFISVPTAASVDGFTSKGAPLILRGVKKTIQTASPVAVFADINILKEAPKEMTAAGFGDILGKYTSLVDWKISDLVGQEPYNQLAANMTRRSLEACINNVHKIANGSNEGIKILMQSLIESGLVMLVLDFSRSASGGEHHLSHYWEMDLLKKDAFQLLHGAKVGITTTIITDLYKLMEKNYYVNHSSSDSEYMKLLVNNWQEIKSLIDKLPSSQQLKRLLKLVGGPTSPGDVQISNELVQESLNEAFNLRDRCTGLFLINQLKKETISYPFT